MSNAVASALRSPRLHLVLRVLLGLYFVHASLAKIADPPAFARIVYQWQVLGPISSNLAAVTLPWVELVAGALLIVGFWKQDAAVVVALMLAVFLVAAGLVLTRGIDVVNCGCTSVAAATTPGGWPPAWTQGVGWYLVVRNLLMLGAALVLGFVEPRTATEGSTP